MSPINGEMGVFISQDHWEKISDRLDILDALEAGGVDNWEGYSSAIEEWNDDA
jgi:hypothetical protein